MKYIIHKSLLKWDLIDSANNISASIHLTKLSSTRNVFDENGVLKYVTRIFEIPATTEDWNKERTKRYQIIENGNAIISAKPFRHKEKERNALQKVFLKVPLVDYIEITYGDKIIYAENNDDGEINLFEGQEIVGKILKTKNLFEYSFETSLQFPCALLASIFSICDYMTTEDNFYYI